MIVANPANPRIAKIPDSTDEPQPFFFFGASPLPTVISISLLENVPKSFVATAFTITFPSALPVIYPSASISAYSPPDTITYFISSAL